MEKEAPDLIPRHKRATLLIGGLGSIAAAALIVFVTVNRNWPDWLCILSASPFIAAAILCRSRFRHTFIDGL